MERFINGFKILWNDERGRAIIKLGLYLIFMTLVVLYARELNSNAVRIETNEKSDSETFFSRNEYLANVRIGDKSISLIGGDVISFNYGESQYTVTDSVLLKNGENTDDFDVSFWNINPKLIGQLLKDREADYVSNFKDGSIKRGYYISLYDFIKEFSGSTSNDLNFESIPEENVTIIIEEVNSKIQNVELELKSYYYFVTSEDVEFNVVLSY